jgi:hypothetical protein
MKPSSQFVLLVTLLGGVGGWLIAAPTWVSLTTPTAIGGLLVILASTLGAAFGVRTGGAQ